MKKLSSLLLVMLLLLSVGCSSVPKDQDTNSAETPSSAIRINSDVANVEVSGIKLSFSERNEGISVIRSYYDEDGQAIAETFAPKEVNDYLFDYDGDGSSELISNCIYGGDGHCEVYVFKIIKGTPYVGTVNWNAEDLDDFDNWGVNAVYTEYDPDQNEFWLTYSVVSAHEDNDSKQIGCKDLLVFEPFEPEK